MNNLDMVWVLGKGSKQNDFEILCSMRSAARHCTGVNRFIVLGDFPRQDIGVPFEYIPHKDLGKSRPQNTTYKLRKLCSIVGVTQNFVLMNDDFFFQSSFDVSSTPYYSPGMLEQHIAWRANNPNNYHGCLKETKRQLETKNQTTRDFEIHGPLIYNRVELDRVIQTYDFSGPFTPLLRSLYCNTVGVVSSRLRDCKIDSPMTRPSIESFIAGRPFFSIGDGGFAGRSVLKEFLTEKCLYETKDTLPTEHTD